MKIRRVESMGISRARLKELEWFVRQYPEKKRRADTDEGARRDVERIEEAAEQAAEGMEYAQACRICDSKCGDRESAGGFGGAGM